MWCVGFRHKNFNNNKYRATEVIGDWFLVIFWCCVRFPHKEFQLCKVPCYTETIKDRFLWDVRFCLSGFLLPCNIIYATVKLSKENIVKVLHVHIVGNKCFNIHTSKKHSSLGLNVKVDGNIKLIYNEWMVNLVVQFIDYSSYKYTNIYILSSVF